MCVSGLLMVLVAVVVTTALVLSPFADNRAVQDSIRASPSAEPICILHGWVNDSVTHEGIYEATVTIIVIADFSAHSTQANETGYYELAVARSPMFVQCVAFGYLLYFDEIDTTGESDYRLDIELTPEPTVPTTTLTIEPDSNVSALNPLSIDISSKDFNLLLVQVMIGQVWNRSGEWMNFTPSAVSSAVPLWGSSGGDFEMDFTYEDDVFEGAGTWSATSNHAGYLKNGTTSELVKAGYIRSINDDVSYGFTSYYYNDTLSKEEGFAWFDNDTGEYEGFEFFNLTTFPLEPNEIPDAPPDDDNGEIVPLVTIWPWRLNSAGDMDVVTANSTREPLSRMSVEDVSFEYSDLAPSGEYVALLIAADEAYNYNWTEELFTVDTDPPVAHAGVDQTIEIGDETTLDGSDSTDNVGLVNHTWTFEDDGLDITLYGEVVSYEFSEIGPHTVTLTVRDGGGNEDMDTVVVEVDEDDSPVAEAGAAELTVPEDVPVTFDGVDSTDDNEVASYAWDIIELGESSTEQAFTFTFEQPGIYHVELVVTDDAEQASESDTVVVTVTDETDPTANAGENLSILIDQDFTLNATGSSDNVDIVEYTWWCDEIEGWEADDAEIDTVLDSEGSYTFTLKVWDAAGNSDTDTVTVQVSDPNEPPIADAGEDTEARTGDTIQLNASQSSDDNGIENYTWSFEYDGETIELYGELAEFTFEIEGTYVIELAVTDGQGLIEHDEVEVVIAESAAVTQFGLYAAVSLAILAGVIAIAFLLLRRKKPSV